MTSPTIERAPQHHGATTPVLANRPLRENTDVETISRFDDTTWDLTPAIVQRHGRTLTLAFNTVPECFRLAAKELFFAILTGDLPNGEEPLSIGSIRRYFSAVKVFLEWAEKRTSALSVLTGHDLADYLRHLRQLRITDTAWRRVARGSQTCTASVCWNSTGRATSWWPEPTGCLWGAKTWLTVPDLRITLPQVRTR